MDFQGRLLGHNEETGSDVFEIPEGSYLRDFPLADDEGTRPSVGDPTGIKTAYVPFPQDGSYLVEATGTAPGTYTLDVRGVGHDGSTRTITVFGVTDDGFTSSYEVVYSSLGGSPLTQLMLLCQSATFRRKSGSLAD
jgi:hypothetical protein